MKAAASAVEADGRIQDWGQRLIEIQDSLNALHERMTGARPERLAGGGEEADASTRSGEDGAAAGEAPSG